jgi:hypothetical protein
MTATTNGEMWTAVRVRDTFLDYFKKNGHTFGGFGSQEVHRSDIDLLPYQYPRPLLYHSRILLYCSPMLA